MRCARFWGRVLHLSPFKLFDLVGTQGFFLWTLAYSEGTTWLRLDRKLWAGLNFPLLCKNINPKHHTGDLPGTAPTGSVDVGIPPAQKVYYEVEGIREDKEGRRFCNHSPLNLDLYIEEKSGRKARPRRLVDMSKLPQAASERLIHDLWRAELGK